MIKDLRGNEIKIGSKIAWTTYSNYDKGNITMHSGEVVDILKKEIGTYYNQKALRDVLRVKREHSSGHHQAGKITTIAAIDRVVVLSEPAEQAIYVPSVFGFETVCGTVSETKVEPSASFTFTVGGNVYAEPIDTLEELTEKVKNLPADQRRQLTRSLIKKSVNLGLKDFKDV